MSLAAQPSRGLPDPESAHERLEWLGVSACDAEELRQVGIVAEDLRARLKSLRARLPQPGCEQREVCHSVAVPTAAPRRGDGVNVAGVHEQPNGLRGLARALARGELSPTEAVSDALQRIEALDPGIGAFVAVDREGALAQAKALADQPREDRGPLWGVPIAVKDVIDVGGLGTEACSVIRAGHRADRDAQAVLRLRRAGAVILGKLNTHEFAYGSTTTSPHRPPSRNPWDRARICGGSSGGSAAAVAAGLIAGALGTDTAGSVRVPATLCGVSGLRPSQGRVSQDGVFPVARTFDTIGPLARDARDCALLLATIEDRGARRAGAFAPLDPHALPGVRGARVGLVQALLDHPDLQPGVAGATLGTAELLADAGAQILTVNPLWLSDAALAQQAIQYTQAAEVHLDWLRARAGDYGPDVRARLLCGLLLEPTAQATGERALIWLRACADALFEQVELLLAPSLPMTAPAIGQEHYRVGDRELPYRAGIIPFNSPWSALGLPALALPAGQLDGMPIGVQLVGPHGADARVLGAGAAIQERSDWHLRRPVLAPCIAEVKVDG